MEIIDSFDFMLSLNEIILLNGITKPLYANQR